MGALVVMVLKLILTTVVSALTREELQKVIDHIHKLHPKAKDSNGSSPTSTADDDSGDDNPDGSKAARARSQAHPIVEVRRAK